MQSSASLDRYIQQVRAIPKLSREDEHQLALQVAEGDQAAADKLVEANLRYVIAIALQYRRCAESAPAFRTSSRIRTS